jgi:hypothetical protein
MSEIPKEEGKVTETGTVAVAVAVAVTIKATWVSDSCRASISRV